MTIRCLGIRAPKNSSAAATGVSGIIAPDGSWTRRTTISTVPVTVVGDVGTPAPALYARIGPLPVELTLLLGAVLPFFLARRRRT